MTKLISKPSPTRVYGLFLLTIEARKTYQTSDSSAKASQLDWIVDLMTVSVLCRFILTTDVKFYSNAITIVLFYPFPSLLLYRNSRWLETSVGPKVSKSPEIRLLSAQIKNGGLEAKLNLSLTGRTFPDFAFKQLWTQFFSFVANLRFRPY